MKKALIIFLLLLNITPAYADQGGWVKVDASGTIISGTIVCTPDVCGDVNSPYAKATLLPGERYVQITKADPVTNNVAGPNVVAPTPANTTVVGKVNPVTNVKCRETFTTMGKTNQLNANTHECVDQHFKIPNDPIVQAYFASLGAFGIYLAYRLMVKTNLLPPL